MLSHLPEIPGDPRMDVVAILGAMAFVVGLAMSRIVLLGWESPSADHARYVYSGLSLLDGRGYVNEAGLPFLFRAPAYPLAAGAAYTIAGWTGAHLLAFLLGGAGLVLAIACGAAVGGWVAAAATTVAIVGSASLWSQLASLGIDLPQTTLLLAATVCLWHPTTWRWLAGGIFLGFAVLAKETAAPAAMLLPLAWLPLWSGSTWPLWLRRSVVFWLAVIATSAWWWLYVYAATGTVFPLNSLAAIVPDAASNRSPLSATELVIAVVTVVVWLSVLRDRRGDVRVRLLFAAALAMLPTAWVVVAMDQPVRSLTPLVLLTCIAAGLAAATLWERGLAVARRGRMAITALAVLAVVAGAVGQAMVPRPVVDTLPAQVLPVMRAGLDPGASVVSTFKYRSLLGVELYRADVQVSVLPIVRVAGAPRLDRMLWLGVRDGVLFGIRRAAWRRALGADDVAMVSFGSPHALTPDPLVAVLEKADGMQTGLDLLATAGEGPTMTVFAVDPRRAVRAAKSLPLTAEPEALLLWMSRAAADGRDGVAEIVSAHPFVDGHARPLAALAKALGTAACLRLAADQDQVYEVREPEGDAACPAVADDAP